MRRGWRTPLEFVEKLDRLKEELGLKSDRDVATALEMKPRVLRARLRRGAFPEDAIRLLAQSRPELGVDVEYVLLGVVPTDLVILGGCWNPGPERQIDLQFALQDLVPAMDFSFDICTKNGCISVASKLLAGLLKTHLRAAIEGELAWSRASYAAKFTVEAGDEQ